MVCEASTLSLAHVSNELGDVVVGKITGRQSPTDITVFDSVGLGSQDLAIGHLYVEQARRRGLGTRIDLAG